jgi:hypothetical protein
MTEHLTDARESAQRTYDRRRARSAADTLATIPPNRWDDHTRRVVATLATISAPSRIDDALEAFDGQPADNLIDVDGTPLPRLFVQPDPQPLPSTMCGRGHLHGAPEAAAACDSLPGAHAVLGRPSDCPHGHIPDGCHACTTACGPYCCCARCESAAYDDAPARTPFDDDDDERDRHDLAECELTDDGWVCPTIHEGAHDNGDYRA